MFLLQPMFSTIDLKQENNKYKIYAWKSERGINFLTFSTTQSFVYHKIFWPQNRVAIQ